MENQPIIYLMGVSGSGKSTVGHLLSESSRIPFFDGDDMHPEANIKKMAAGQSLNDDDRAGWLQAIHDLALQQMHTDGAIIVCSALKKKYRDQLADGIPSVLWVHLHGDQQLILDRMQKRAGHFMPPALLQSQFDTLEEPKNALKIDIKNPPQTIIEIIMENLQSSNPSVLQSSEFGLIGLGVMGKSLARNLGRNGFRLSLFNRHVPGKEERVAERCIAEYDELSGARGFDDLEKFVASLERPHRIFFMVNAGPVVDAVIESLRPHLAEGDILIEGGNSHYRDTERRTEELAKQGIHLVGTGVSGGELGALNGPSIMPGGSTEAYAQVSRFLEKIAARDANGQPCCAHIGRGGAGHFVKMVHNGIEYAEMQLLAEVYQILKNVNGLSNDQIADLLAQWNEGDLSSYLLEITVDILRKKEGDQYLLDLVLDQAGNKGTGSWTTIASAELGVPTTMISAALFARYLSAFKSERVAAAELFGSVESPLFPPQGGALQPGAKSLEMFDVEATNIKKSKPEIRATQSPLEGGRGGNEGHLETAYRIARIVNHHQGIHLISAASEAYDWKLNLSELARIWTNGCIIRSALMTELISILAETDRILTHPFFTKKLSAGKAALAQTAGQTIALGENIPCFAAASNFLYGYTSAQSSANMIQAQRDCFGAHTYRRVDDPDGGPVHSEWQAG